MMPSVLHIIGLPCFPYSYQLALGLCGGFFNEGYPLPQLLKTVYEKIKHFTSDFLIVSTLLLQLIRYFHHSYDKV